MMLTNAGVAAAWSDFPEDQDQIPAERVHREPQPGHARLDDLISANSVGNQCELVDARLRTVSVYSSVTQYRIRSGEQSVGGRKVLPGREVNLAELFRELDRQPPSARSGSA